MCWYGTCQYKYATILSHWLIHNKFFCKWCKSWHGMGCWTSIIHTHAHTPTKIPPKKGTPAVLKFLTPTTSPLPHRGSLKIFKTHSSAGNKKMKMWIQHTNFLSNMTFNKIKNEWNQKKNFNIYILTLRYQVWIIQLQEGLKPFHEIFIHRSSSVLSFL